MPRVLGQHELAELHYAVTLAQAEAAAWALDDSFADRGEVPPASLGYDLASLAIMNVQRGYPLADALGARRPTAPEQRIDLIHEALARLEEHSDQYREWLREKALD